MEKNCVFIGVTDCVGGVTLDVGGVIVVLGTGGTVVTVGLGTSGDVGGNSVVEVGRGVVLVGLLVGLLVVVLVGLEVVDFGAGFVVLVGFVVED